MRLLHRRPKLGRSSVREGFDNLPSGVCFAGGSGAILLCNRQMYRLCHQLMGMDLQHIGELRRALDSPTPPVEGLGGRIFRFSDGTLWQFSEGTVVDAEGEVYTQVQAVDVTELHRRKAQLERENRALAEANLRARVLYAELDRIVREKETLSMKMRIHDDMGQCLLATRRLLLEKDSSLEDFRAGGRRWADTLDRITGAGDGAHTAGDPLAEAVASAAEIGVHTMVEGDPPAGAENARLVAAAMRECATNTVRHAGGSEMAVRLFRTQRSDIVVITNNGRAPEGEIVEGGGLSGLRRSVEDRQGTMTVESQPAFRLTIALPREEESQ